MKHATPYVICVSVLVGLCLVAGCQQVHPAAAQVRLTPGQVQNKLVVGKTSKLDVIKAMGSPNIVMLKSGEAEVWTYDQISIHREDAVSSLGAYLGAGSSMGSEAGIGGVAGLGGSSASRATSVRTVTLIIEFDEKGLVKNYEMMSTAF